MNYFLRRANPNDHTGYSHYACKRVGENVRECIIRYGDFILTGYFDFPDDGQVRVSLDAGFSLDGFSQEYSKFNDIQRRMLNHNLHYFMGWFRNMFYDIELEYIYYARYKSTHGVTWPICNVVALESEESIIHALINLSYTAAVTISEIKNTSITVASSQQLLSEHTRKSIDIIDDFLTYCNSRNQ